jgi:hypothetical protein
MISVRADHAGIERRRGSLLERALDFRHGSTRVLRGAPVVSDAPDEARYHSQFGTVWPLRDQRHAHDIWSDQNDAANGLNPRVAGLAEIAIVDKPHGTSSMLVRPPRVVASCCELSTPSVHEYVGNATERQLTSVSVARRVTFSMLVVAAAQQFVPCEDLAA